ncbi:hypothetical protein [Pseudoflavonifractor phocaeensis]|uniref:hypothetical protein n=1 Tax=Pseudoflavonifractor phocaeensis TaxID=1870988 RepID=UPI00210891D8|nr:hypothetical protein [Pseudoflavonifractor phocaeensis]MCQ4864152.1 hypothetical protein [Pseudoflavonifractor phocaeensis]
MGRYREICRALEEARAREARRRRLKEELESLQDRAARCLAETQAAGERLRCAEEAHRRAAKRAAHFAALDPSRRRRAERNECREAARQAEWTARLRYDLAIREMTDSDRRVAVVRDALRELGGEDGRYGELLEEKSAILRRLRGPVGEKARALWARLDQESARRDRLEELTALGGAAIKSMDRAYALLQQGVQYANGQLVCSDVEGAVSEARTLMDAFDRLLVEESLPARPSLNRNFSGIMDVGLLSPMLAEMLLGNSLGNARVSVLDACRQVESVMPDLEKALERSRLLCGRLGDQLAELTMDG